MPDAGGADLARRAGNIEDIIRAATNHMYLLIRAGRFAEARAVAGDARQTATSLGAPPALTSMLDNNTAWVLIATGHWDEAAATLDSLVAEAPANVTGCLQLLQPELAPRPDPARPPPVELGRLPPGGCAAPRLRPAGGAAADSVTASLRLEPPSATTATKPTP